MTRNAAPWLTTHLGYRVNPLDLHPSLVRLEDIAHALAHLCRFAGHSAHFYSVAEHSLLVAQLVPPPLALHGLLHDADEAYTGDLIAPIKRALAEHTTWWSDLEARIDAAIAEYFDLRPLDAEERAALKHADRVALVTEYRDLFPDDRGAFESWVGPRRSTTLGVAGLPPRLARDRFVARFHELTEACPDAFRHEKSERLHGGGNW